MASEWRTVRLGDVVAINPDAIGPDWPFPHIKYVDISSVGEGIVIEPPSLMSLAEAPSRAKRLVRKGDTVLSTVRPNRRSMFFVSESEPDLVVSTGFAVLRPKPGMIHPRYLYACVFDKAFTGYLVSREKGAAYPAVLPEDIADATINLPPLPEQRAIAHILGTLDDKIELNRRMSETLEAMARALFKAWFVDFETVRAKMEGRWRRGESLPGLPAHLWDLFPDRLVPSELGEIPEGWEVKNLDEIADFLNGIALQKYSPGDGPTLPVIKIAQLIKGSPEGADRCNMDFPPKYVINDGDVLFSWSGSLECVLWAGGKGALNQHLFKVTSAHFPKWFYYLWIHQHLPDFRHIAVGKATTMGHIQRHHLTDAKVVVSGPPVLEVADKVIAPLIEQAMKRRVESRTLAALRDALLPKLIRGEIRVKDAEKLVEAQAWPAI